MSARLLREAPIEPSLRGRGCEMSVWETEALFQGLQGELGGRGPLEIGLFGFQGEMFSDGRRRPVVYATLRVPTTSPVGVVSLRVRVVAATWEGSSSPAAGGADADEEVPSHHLVLREAWQSCASRASYSEELPDLGKVALAEPGAEGGCPPERTIVPECF